MGLKKGKYVYIKLGEDRYVKVRVFTVSYTHLTLPTTERV